MFHLIDLIQIDSSKYYLIYIFIAVFRQGDIGTSWYAVLSGSLDVKVSETANHQVSVYMSPLKNKQTIKKKKRSHGKWS